MSYTIQMPKFGKPSVQYVCDVCYQVYHELVENIDLDNPQSFVCSGCDSIIDSHNIKENYERVLSSKQRLSAS